jgi:CRP/FNR family transcriptional regulator
MPTPYNLDLQHSCIACTHNKEGRFCDLAKDTIGTFDKMKFAGAYPKGATLFVEGEMPRGVFVLCSGKAKLTTSSTEGKTLIVKLAVAGDILGASAAILGKPYEVSAETTEPAQVNFVSREDFLRLLSLHSDASMSAAQQLAKSYHAAQHEIRSLGLSQTTSEKLARLLLDWSETGEETPKGIRLKVMMTHEEIAQMIGTTRETVTRLLSDFKRRHVIDVKGSTFLIPKTSALQDMVSI